MLNHTTTGSNPGTLGLGLSVLGMYSLLAFFLLTLPLSSLLPLHRLTLPSWRHSFSAFSPHYSTQGSWETQAARGK